VAAPSQGAPEASGQPVEVVLDRIAQAESQLATRPGDLPQREHLGNLYYDLGEGRDHLGDKQGARQAFLRAIEHYEAVRQAKIATPDVLTDLGTMYFRSGQAERAVKAYEEAIAKDPRHRNAWMNLGIVKREGLGDQAGARQAWERFLEISPTGPDAERVRTWLTQVSVPGG
jgi:tetratricopeptide (TPR) repeat protein